MSQRSAIFNQDLLAEPFGPFQEEHALTSDVRNTTAKNPLVLDCVQFELEGTNEIVGLDECEPCQPEYDLERCRHVTFTGVLEISNLKWLSPETIDTIGGALQERDRVARIATHRNALPDSQGRNYAEELNFWFSFDLGLKIRVIIRGEKWMPVSYLQSIHVPKGLMLVARSTRRYEVASLHIETYERSRKYLARWRLLHELQKLLGIDAGPGKSWSDNKTPLAGRTPEWFAELYLRHRAYSFEQRRQRPIYDSDSDSDIEPGANGRLKRGREHSPRSVSQEEVLTLIEQHGQWVMDQVKQRKHGKWLDLRVWALWFASADARVADGRSSPPECSTGRKVVNKERSKRGLARQVSPRSPSPMAVDARLPYPTHGRKVDEAMLRTYDPDFSPQSTTLGSPVSSPGRPSTPVDPDLLALLPSQLWQPPNVNSLQIWTCPWKNCSYVIDLFHLTDEDMDHQDITEEDKQRFRRKQWSRSDAWAREAFAYMVDRHHHWHFNDAGIDVDLVGDRYAFRWRYSSSQPRPTQFRNVKVDDRRPEPDRIKEEAS
ncbi:hypothetical protein BD311DRAFT_709628 [Dichomitus squalens]|uniref:Uncharacterized protein n=1 Tax=Dichomitus squalens TaxID=114155 RepID=A0A4Q9N7E1_9APHY|nr:hypothetical protein BD311DRAFT_709628 [Dichomitus squalens]